MSLLKSGLVFFSFTPDYAKSSLKAPGARDGISQGANWTSECLAVMFLITVIQGAGDKLHKRVLLPNLAVGYAIVSVCTIGVSIYSLLS